MLWPIVQALGVRSDCFMPTALTISGSMRSISPSARDFFPSRLTLPSMRKASRGCRGCQLYRDATQVVFGEGPADAQLMLVGEAPGDQEDQQGKPFVGPVGTLLDDALASAGMARERVYVTNAVKHFKWQFRGKRRLHSKPVSRELAACSPWLEAEINAVRPRVIVCLGATAAQLLLGRGFRVTRQRGDLIASPWAKWVMATFHPSAVLRAPDSDTRRKMQLHLVDDLRDAVAALAIAT